MQSSDRDRLINELGEEAVLRSSIVASRDYQRARASAFLRMFLLAILAEGVLIQYSPKIAWLVILVSIVVYSVAAVLTVDGQARHRRRFLRSWHRSREISKRIETNGD